MPDRLKLAVIGTFHGRHANTLPLLRRVLKESSRPPDELYVMCEDADDLSAANSAITAMYPERRDPARLRARLQLVPTPRDGVGRLAVIPYSWKINKAFDQTDADAVVFLDNNSVPSVDKYRVMVEALEQNPDWGAVYVGQHRTGFSDDVFLADEVIENAHGRLNYTQVCFRTGPERWTVDLRWANPDIADGMFWAALHPRLGPFHPCGGSTVHDEHHIPSAAASGL